MAGKDSAAENGGKSQTPATKTEAHPISNGAGDTNLSTIIPADPQPLPSLALGLSLISAETSAQISAPTKSNSAVAAVASVAKDGGMTTVAPANLNAADQASQPTGKDKIKFPVTELSPTKTGGVVDSPSTAAVKTEAVADSPAKLKIAEPVDSSSKAVSAVEKKSSELAAGVLTAHAAETAGTGVATVDLPMKKSANTNKVAGLDGKVLPGEASVAARAKVLPATVTAGPVRAAEGISANLNFSPALPGTVSPADVSTAQPTLVLPSLTDARMRNLERTHDMVALHAVRLVQAQTDTLSVVIKPGAGTELSLELRQRDGGIEAQATLSRGDFQLMNQHWSELQQRLEQRGIKLAPLGGEAGFSTDSGGNFQQQQDPSSRELEAQKASAFAEFALASRAIGATARLAVGIGGWESWA